jgi:hypothetical protein
VKYPSARVYAFFGTNLMRAPSLSGPWVACPSPCLVTNLSAYGMPDTNNWFFHTALRLSAIRNLVMVTTTNWFAP